MTGARIIHKVAVTASPVAAHIGYHAIGARAHGVSVTDATDTNRWGYH